MAALFTVAHSNRSNTELQNKKENSPSTLNRSVLPPKFFLTAQETQHDIKKKRRLCVEQKQHVFTCSRRRASCSRDSQTKHTVVDSVIYYSNGLWKWFVFEHNLNATDNGEYWAVVTITLTNTGLTVDTNIFTAVLKNTLNGMEIRKLCFVLWLGQLVTFIWVVTLNAANKSPA